MDIVRIILVPVNYHNARELCEYLQNQTFNSIDALMGEVKTQMGDSFTEFGDRVMWYSLNNLMDDVNDQEFDIMTEYFMSYVTIRG
jgi:hypothetical protein